MATLAELEAELANTPEFLGGFEETPEFLRRQGLQDQLREQDLQRALRLGPIQEELLTSELERVRRGPAATDEQKRLIGEATEAALTAGRSDIGRFRELNLESLREELAPSLGLRPTDSPILDRGARIAEEAARQEGQLVSRLRGVQATAELNFPLAASQLQSAQTQFQQTLAEDTKRFQETLRQRAFTNRLNLTGQIGGQQIALATGINPNLGSLQTSLAQRQIAGSPTTQTAGLGLSGVVGIAGGIGGLLSGGSAVGLF